MCLLKHHKKQTHGNVLWFGSRMGAWTRMAPHSSSYFPRGNLLNRTVLKDFREHHNPEDALLVTSQLKTQWSRFRLHTSAGTAPSASAPHLTLTHDWMWCQSLTVLVMCHLPLPAKYPKSFWKQCTHLLPHYALKHWVLRLHKPLKRKGSEVYRLPSWVWIQVLTTALTPLAVTAQTPEFSRHHEWSCLFWWSSSSITADLCIQPNAEAGRLLFVASQSIFIQLISVTLSDKRQPGLPDFLNASETHC